MSGMSVVMTVWTSNIKLKEEVFSIASKSKSKTEKISEFVKTVTRHSTSFHSYNKEFMEIKINQFLDLKK